MNKVPCGGFELDKNFLGMNKNGELSLISGASEDKAYKQLVTDKDGEAKWEERLCYSEPLTSVPYPALPDSFWYKVSDSIPTGDVSIETECTVWSGSVVGNAEVIISETDYYCVSDGAVVVTLKDNVTIQDISATFPEKGTYFLVSEAYGIKTTGFSIGKVSTPEITWDGNPSIIKKLDSKFIPSELNEVILPSTTSGSTKKFKITVDDSGTISATEVAT